jgi:Cupin
MEIVSVDPLTQLVELLRPRALLWKHMVGQGDWAWRLPADSGVVFGRVVSGYCRFQLPGTAEQSLEPGDCVLLTEPPAWILRGGAGDAAIVDFENLPTDTASPEPGRSEDDPNQVRIVGGHFEFDSVNKELLMAFLSPIVHIRLRGSGDGGRLTGVLAMIDAEASATRPGQEAVLSPPARNRPNRAAEDAGNAVEPAARHAHRICRSANRVRAAGLSCRYPQKLVGGIFGRRSKNVPIGLFAKVHVSDWPAAHDVRPALADGRGVRRAEV